MLTERELGIINRALDRGNDVRIQQTRDGVRIIEDKIKVLCRLMRQEAENTDTPQG